MKKLNVIEVTDEEFEEKWGFSSNSLPPSHRDTQLYVKCNKEGKVNWDKTPVYNKTELKEYDYTIITIINVDEIIKNEEDQSK